MLQQSEYTECSQYELQMFHVAKIIHRHLAGMAVISYKRVSFGTYTFPNRCPEKMHIR